VRLLSLLAGVAMIATILWDAFETVVLPRTVSRRLRSRASLFSRNIGGRGQASLGAASTDGTRQDDGFEGVPQDRGNHRHAGSSDSSARYPFLSVPCVTHDHDMRPLLKDGAGGFSIHSVFKLRQQCAYWRTHQPTLDFLRSRTGSRPPVSGHKLPPNVCPLLALPGTLVS